MKFSQEELDNLLKSSSKNLASLIVIHRTMNIFKDEAKACMLELSKRDNENTNDPDFNFKEFIKEECEKYKFNINIPNVSKIKYNISNMLTSTVINEFTKQKSSSQNDNSNNENDDEDDEDDWNEEEEEKEGEW